MREKKIVGKITESLTTKIQSNKGKTASKTIVPNASETIEQIANNKIEQIGRETVDVIYEIKQKLIKTIESGTAKHFLTCIDNLQAKYSE